MRKLMMFVTLLISIKMLGQQNVVGDTSTVCLLGYSDSKKVIEPIRNSISSPLRYEIRELPPLKAFRVPLVSTIIRGAYTIGLASGANMSEDCEYELEDLLTGVTFDLRKGTYSFHVNRNVSDRFVIYVRPRTHKIAGSK